MHARAAVPRVGGERLERLERHDRAAVTVVGVFDAHQRRARHVVVLGILFERLVDLRRRHPGPLAAHGVREQPGVGRHPGLLVEEEVGERVEHHLLAGRGEHVHRELVPHRAARHEQPGLLAGQLGDAALERLHGGVVAEHVVADLGVGDGATHAGSRAGDGVAAQVHGAHEAGECSAFGGAEGSAVHGCLTRVRGGGLMKPRLPSPARVVPISRRVRWNCASEPVD